MNREKGENEHWCALFKKVKEYLNLSKEYIRVVGWVVCVFFFFFFEGKRGFKIVFKLMLLLQLYQFPPKEIFIPVTGLKCHVHH